MSQLPILYSRTSTGAVQQWQIVVEGDKFYTIEGQKDGKLTTATPTICEGKNIGKANETSGEDQAIKEAKSKWQKKIDGGYHQDIKDIDIETFTEPMLAKNFNDDFNDKFPVWCQPKLDGMRCVCRADGMWSRNGKQILSAPHIRKALDKFFTHHPDGILDGELYCDKLTKDFNKIISLVKKTKPEQSDLDESAKTIQYHIYDYISAGKLNFKKRNEELCLDLAKAGNPAMGECIRIVRTYECANKEDLDKYYGEFLDQGYEGQMVRLDKPYEHKRSKSLLKRKEFIDSEYTVVDVCEGAGNRSGTAGWLVLKMDDGRTFKSNIKGPFSYLKKLLVDRKELIGKIVTVKYFQLTPDGIPRFPYMTSVRDYE
jgi:DNA ligase-1